MKIRLAGFNADIDLLMDAAQFFDRDGVDSAALSPETISAAYARISRDPKSVTALRAAAIKDVAKARASNEQIVFGMGHASVAEHAVFNFDLMGVSRLVIEAIEQARLCSYTEKSQRYTQLGEEFVVPQEIVEAGLEADFKALLAEQYAAQALQPLIDSGRARSVTVTSEQPHDGRCLLLITVEDAMSRVATYKHPVAVS